jgi:DNA-binding transcriptional LysR family regulator
MNDQQLKSLLKTVECGSFSKAEEILYLSKQALKKQIDSLEQELGFTLLVRTHNGITLTPAGAEFCGGAKKILNEIDSITQKCKALDVNEQIIRIENPYHPRLLLENVIIEFSKRFPCVKQQVILRTSSHFLNDLFNDHADVVECIYHPGIDSSGLKFTKLFPLPYKCLVAPSHPLFGKKFVNFEELSGNYIGLLKKNIELIAQLNEHCHDISLETFIKNDIQDILNICYNNGVFISKAYFVDFLQPLLAIPLETDLMPVAGVLHRESPSPIVIKFLNVLHELYPKESEEN